MFRVFNQYVSAKSLLLMFAEGVLIVLSLFCAVQLRFWNNAQEASSYIALPDFALQVAIVVVVCLGCFYCNDLYNLTAGMGGVDSLFPNRTIARRRLPSPRIAVFSGSQSPAVPRRLHHCHDPGGRPCGSQQKTLRQSLAVHGAESPRHHSRHRTTGNGLGPGADHPQRPRLAARGICLRFLRNGRRGKALRLSGPGTDLRHGSDCYRTLHFKNRRRSGGSARSVAHPGAWYRCVSRACVWRMRPAHFPR